MKESSFIKKNLESWKEFEQINASEKEMPQKLSKLFVKITDDLSYAYTYYNNRLVRVYLNSAAKSLYSRINRSEKFRFSKIKHFFTHELPLAIFNARKEFIISLALFAISMLIGIVSSKYDPEFARLILGDSYIEMTEKNIANNDPMAVYKSMAPFDMFFAITVNNCLVALRTFVMGFFMALGTVLIMLYNGIMMGCFQYFFIEQGLFKESFLTIWQHGVFEISSIIMAGAAGLVLGKGLVFPGNYSRFQSLRISARKGLKIILGIIPILVVAGFIEGFYTRFTSTPEIIRVITILFSLAFILGYFVVLPKRRYRQNQEYVSTGDYVTATQTTTIEMDKIYTASEVFMLTFQQLRIHLSKILKWAALVALIFPLCYIAFEALSIAPFSDNMLIFQPVKMLIANPIPIAIILISITVFVFFLSKLNLHTESISHKTKMVPQFLLQVISLLLIVHLPLFIPNAFFGILFYAVLLAYSNLIFSFAIQEQSSIFNAAHRSFKYLTGSFSKFATLCSRFFILGLLFYILFNLLIVTLNKEFIEMNLYGSTELAFKILFNVKLFYFVFFLLFVFAVFYLSNTILYFSLHETIMARGLNARIDSIGTTKRRRGLIHE